LEDGAICRFSAPKYVLIDNNFEVVCWIWSIVWKLWHCTSVHFTLVAKV
jgi:hypothetical protein